MQKNGYRRTAAMVLTAVLLGSSASALFGLGKGSETMAQEGAPTVQDIEIHTYRGIPYQAQLLGSDSEGDNMTFTVAEAPKKGEVTIDGANFTYTPKETASGNDRFTYIATDSQGNTSMPATVTVTIEKTRSGVTYSDTGESVATAAQYLAEAGIFCGAQIGGRYYFEPEAPVSRHEFLAMAMEAAGKEVTPVTMTGFCDDEAIPTWAKAYAAAGVAEGIVRGKTTEEGPAFYGDDAITFNEAATMLDRVLNMGNVELEAWYADRSTVPSWAAQAVGNMEALHVLQAGSFGSGTMEQAITRADAATMLMAAKTLLDGQQTSGIRFWLQ